MLLVDRKPLDLEALSNVNHSLYKFAKEFDDTLDYLKKHYKDGVIRIKKIGYPKYTKGADSNFREIPKVQEPETPWRIPLRAYVAVGDLGKHTWMCCLDPPEVLANGLYDMPQLSDKKGLSMKEAHVINIAEQPDLAFFLYKISPFIERPGHKGLFRIADPILEDEEIGVEEMALTRRKYAVWNMLTDVNKLKKMASAYGVADVDNKQPNAIRKELEELLEKNDKAKKQNPAVKGTSEFEEEMRVTDGILLRAFVQKAVDDKKLECKSNGMWRIGEKAITQVPHSELERKRDYLCNYLMMGDNQEKLQEFIKDLINQEYLDAIPDSKDGNKEWRWLAKVAGHESTLKKTEEVKQLARNFFCPLL